MKHFSMIGCGVAISALVLAGCTEGTTPQVDRADVPPEAPHEEGVVRLTRENLQHATIKTVKVEKGSIDVTLKAAGRVAENLNKTAKVASPLEGRLEHLSFDIGDRVKEGDVLAVVTTPELLGKPLEIKAPIGGMIIERKAAVGELVDKANPICTISDPADLWVIAEVKERDIAAVKDGQDAAFSVLAYPGETFHGQVIRIGNQVEADTRTVEVRIAADNRDGRLKPGMFADVEITTTVLQDALVIPDDALQTDEESEVDFVMTGENRYEKRPVRLGLEQRGRVQVLDGLKAGDAVATEGSFILKSELLKGELGEE